MKNHWTAVFVFIMATSCIPDTGTSPGSAGGAGSGGNGSGGNGSGGNGSGGNTPDAGVPESDAFPKDAVSFFYRLACPFGWSPYHDAAGRMIIGANEELKSGATIGEKPLSSGEDRLHTHTLSATFTLAPTSLVAPGGINGILTDPAPTTQGIDEGKTDAMPAGVPYRQLLVCKKMVDPLPNALKLPAKLHAYFASEACPPEWLDAADTPGRILVGLPKDAVADKPMGGEPMTTSEPRTHKHAFTGALVTLSQGVLAPSGPGTSFGANGSHPFMGESDAAAVDIPMIALKHCEKL